MQLTAQKGSKARYINAFREVLPQKIDQITVTQEFLKMTSEETGCQVFTHRASSLQQDKATEVARLKGQEEAKA